MKKIVMSILLMFFAFACENENGNEVTTTEPTENTIAGKYGRLQAQGNQIVDQNGQPVVLRGMSLFWSQWIGKYYNADCVKWLKDDWKCTAVRAAVGISQDGYLGDPAGEMSKIKTVINASIAEGIYVIVDWHDHHAEDHQAEAIAFFKDIATEYGDHPNVIYEIYNEPLQISWPNVIKPYAEAVIAEIRAIDPDNLIIVGTPTWSQDVDVAANDPIDDPNVAYTLHFYAATHKQSLRNKAATALAKGIPLFVTEWGTTEANGDVVVDKQETAAWINFMEQNKLSWLNWSVADKDEKSAALLPGAPATGGWNQSHISESGQLVKGQIQRFNTAIFQALEE